MGQAKKRGSLEERIKQAEARQDNYYGEVITIEAVRERLGLTDDFNFDGYVIHLPDQDEFVGFIQDDLDTFQAMYVKIPDVAKKYSTPEAAIADAKKINKYKLLVCVVLSNGKQDYICDLWANF